MPTPCWLKHLCSIRQRRQWHPTPVLLPGKSHGWRSLVGCSPWGCKELDTTEWLHFHFSFSCIGGGNGNPLQCSCLENSRDGGAWWAAVYGVAQSRTRLKWLSSSSSSSSIRALVPVSCFLSLSLSGSFFGAQRPSGFTFLPGLLRPSREGTLHLHPIKRAPEAFMNRASPVSGTLLVFCVNQGISASFSLLYFLIVDSGPPGSSPLKDLNKWRPE